jgi:hypothetical protein
MPCNCDHLEPTAFEQEAERTLKLLKFVTSKMTQNQQDIFSKNPDVLRFLNSKITYQRDIYNQDAEKYVNWFTRTLCALIPKMRENQIFDIKNPTSRDLADWWDAHRKADREKVKAIRETKKKNALRASALAKLKPSERKALNL